VICSCSAALVFVYFDLMMRRGLVLVVGENVLEGVISWSKNRIDFIFFCSYDNY